MLGRTLRPRTLVVASAFPDLPFELVINGTRSGFDVELMHAICRQLEIELQTVPYIGDDFNGIFGGLAARTYDAVISGTTITPERSAVVLFSQPRLEFNQGVAVNGARAPHVLTVADLHGLTASIQSGNTSDIVARELWSSPISCEPSARRARCDPRFSTKRSRRQSLRRRDLMPKIV